MTTESTCHGLSIPASTSNTSNNSTGKGAKREKKVKHNFVFGYGLLICEKSRSITNPGLAEKEALPVIIQDVERVWSARTKTGYTAMGVQFNKGSECTGVLIEIDTEEELADLDRREANYDRRPIQLDNIDQVPFLDEGEYYEDDHPVFDAKDAIEAAEEAEEAAAEAGDTKAEEEAKDDQQIPHDNVKVWIYIQRNPIPADPSHPIPQSYVDIIIRGCLSISEEFAKSVVETTSGWQAHIHNKDDDANHNWVDDREVPIYKRADSEYSNAHGEKIDQLMKGQFDDLNTGAYLDRVEYDPMDHLEALAGALEDDKAHPLSIKHVVTQVKKDAARKEEEAAEEELTT